VILAAMTSKDPQSALEELASIREDLEDTKEGGTSE